MFNSDTVLFLEFKSMPAACFKNMGWATKTRQVVQC